MLSKTPVRETKRTVRRKLASTKDTKSNLAFPINKKSKVVNAEHDLTGDTQESVPKHDIEELLSQEVSGFLSNGLPRVSWQPQMITSPLQVDPGSRDYGGIIANASADVRDTEPVSTNYLARIWKNQQNKREKLSHNDCTPDNRNKPDWLDKMFSMVSELEDHNSKSPTPDAATTPRTQSSSSHLYTSVIHKSAVLTSPEDKCEMSANLTSSAVKPGVSRSGSQTYTKLEANSSLFSDSMDGFTTDFTLSDVEPDDENTKSSSVVPRADNSQETPPSTSTAQPIVKTQDDQPISTEVEVEPIVKSEPLLSVVKQEVKTPPNISAKKKMSRKASPGTPLRRYSSHDSAMRSPLPNTDKTPANSNQSELLQFSHLIEEKRKLALSRLKSRKGSLVRHRSLDNTAIVSQSTASQSTASQTNASQSNVSQAHASQSNASQRLVSQSAASQTNIGQGKTLEQLIEEKRRLAAEKLQKHREESCDQSNSMSGSLHHRRHSGNHDKTVTNTEFSTQGDGLTFGLVLSNKENKSATGQPETKGEVLSQTSLSSQGSAFAGKIALDTLIEDLERESPRKAKQPLDAALECGPAMLKPSGSVARTVPNAGNLQYRTQQSATDKSQLCPRNMQAIDNKTLLAIEQKRKTALEKRKLSKLQNR